MLNIILFGPPGAGKGTQSEKIIGKYGLTHISTGDLFRKHLSEGTPLGKEAQRYMDQGNLVPDKVVIGMVDQFLKEHQDAEGFLFDGFPRTVAQAQALDALMEQKDMHIAVMIALEVDHQELVKRLQLRGETSGRSDDQHIDKIENRIQVYHRETLPVATYYEKQDKLEKVNGVGSIEEIFSSISNVIEKHV